MSAHPVPEAVFPRRSDAAAMTGAVIRLETTAIITFSPNTPV